MTINYVRWVLNYLLTHAIALAWLVFEMHNLAILCMFAADEGWLW